MNNEQRDTQIGDNRVGIAENKAKLEKLEGQVKEHHDTLYREEGVCELLKAVATLQHDCRRRDAARPASWQAYANMAAVIIALLALLWGIFGDSIKGAQSSGITSSIIQRG